MSDELKPCPFCGGEAKVGSLAGDKENWAIWCDTDKCGGGCFETSYDEPCKEKMFNKWNTRAEQLPEDAALAIEIFNKAKTPKFVGIIGGEFKDVFEFTAPEQETIRKYLTAGKTQGNDNR